MARKGKEVASASTPSRNHTTKNSNGGRDDGFPTECFDSQIHYDRWKTMENMGITHERFILFSDRESNFMHDRVEGLGWGFMYNAFALINVTMVRKFCGNFFADHQTHVFLWGKWIPFSEDDICRHLGIHTDLPPLGENDNFKKIVDIEKQNGLDMDMVFHVIGRQGTNWANNPADNTIPRKKIDNAILNAGATAWHKLIMVNIDPKPHGTTFDMDHAILIYVLMTEGIVNLPRIMRDVLLKRSTGNSRNFLPYPVPEFPRDEIYHVREQDMYCPYGDWKGEEPKVRHGRLIPPPQAPPAPQEEQPPPSPPPQPAAYEIPSSSVRRPPEPSLREVMRCLRRQERL
ncbi:hypothetical protein PIB30_079052 [Stylosanthes scabra]|uniref:Putative plant transposon protein domain-containing protein n=1 Tax=Stylosanthes scabra TaxID=79078 RepID=A0ABU6QRG0_9FABA|nr:hypothetical protein [Stylosanthes scabra]